MKAFWNLGFRPFFLFGSLWASLHILVWVAFQSGKFSFISINDPVTWHAHEMIFGFATAIVAGFLLTATQNWTGIRGIHGKKLKILVCIWILARLFSMVSGNYYALYAVVDLSFYPLLAWFLKPYLWQKSQRRNQVFFLLFFFLFIANAIIHINHFQHTSLLSSRSILLFSIYVIVMMIALIGGRVLPLFTRNSLPAANPTRKPWIEWMSFTSIITVGISIVFFEFTRLSAGLAFLAGTVHMIRWLLWKPWKSIGLPILFILYVGYVWIPIGLLMRGMASLSFVTPSLSTHAFTAGAIGTMIYAMITRVSLGHMGLPIRAGKPILFGYILIIISAFLRVFGPWISPEQTSRMIELSGYLWSLAFLIYVIVYAPILLSPRMDGKDG